MRRTGALVLAVTCLVAPACSTFTDRDDVARVGDATLTVDELEALVTPPAADTPTAQTQPEPTASSVRPAIAAWVLTEVLKDDIESRDGEVTDADRQAAETQLAQQFPQQWQTSPQPVKQLLIERSAALAKWNQVSVSADELQPFRADYEAGIETSGVACVAHILVDSEDEADAVLDELDGDADRFAELARERSTDEASGANGGNLPCTDADQFSAAYLPAFVQASLDAEVGTPVGPVETEFGYHVIVVRPWEDVAAEVAPLYSAERFADIASDTAVYVNPLYGEFDPETALVEPLAAGTPRE